MEISSKSWHMRLNQYTADLWTKNPAIRKGRVECRKRGWPEDAIEDYFPWYQYEPQNLCIHFRNTVGALYILPLFLTARFLWRYMLRHAVRVIVVVALGLGATSIWVWSKRPRRKQLEPVSKEPSLVFEYLKARKQRICPLITVRED